MKYWVKTLDKSERNNILNIVRICGWKLDMVSPSDRGYVWEFKTKERNALNFATVCDRLACSVALIDSVFMVR